MGETAWVYRALEDGAGRPRGGATRGVGYWHDPERDDERVFVVSGEQLVALEQGPATRCGSSAPAARST